MKPKYKLFLMILPFVILCFAFAYLPLWGWRYALFDYKPGRELTWDRFVGLKWFTFLFQNPATRADIARVLRNTLVMSGLGLAFSWLPMAFAIFLAEIRSSKVSRVVQTCTTIPNFISWVLVYSFAFALFSTEGFVNSLLINMGIIKEGVNYLMSGEHIWLKMWAWGTWKGLGWSAIIYIAGISGIDIQLYEAATIDGAGRFKRMWYITVPGLLPTFFVLLLLSVAGILSNGMEQYFVFKNSANKQTIEVLDLYVYILGLGSGGSGNIPLATAVGMMKSLISITLLFAANWASKLIRGESIV
ncbi:MAG TPA: ABC transporter permease subunit [Candidatus Atribacteria bacterium]|nr:ABC transporter permease subunit [Candidatus Atribacteria bacterium]HPT79266.1 ABC transporter permease subunit [Candidatus Atribacteria bacterium]